MNILGLKMARFQVIILTFFLLIAVAIFCYGIGLNPTQSDAGERPQLLVTDRVPDLKFNSLANQQFALNSLQGKIVILNFWASFCGPCLEEFPSMIKLIKQFEGKIILLGVSYDDSVQDIKEFTDKFKDSLDPLLKDQTIRLVWDQDQKIGREHFSVLKLPESFIIDQKGFLVKKITGSVDWVSADMVAYFNKVGTDSTIIAQPLETSLFQKIKNLFN